VTKGLSFEDLGALVRAAEAERRRGDLRAARAIYTAAFATRIDAAHGSAAALLPEDLLVIEELAGLVAITGEPRKAIELLRVVIRGADLRTNVEQADGARLKLLHFLLTEGEFDEARRVLGELAPRIGDVETVDVSDEGLRRYEDAIAWPPNDCESLLPSLYHELARFATALGMGVTALALARRGKALVGAASNADVRELATPLDLTAAAALADLGDATGALVVLETLTIDPKLHPGWALLALEVRGRASFLRGKLRQASDALATAAELAEQSGSLRAVAVTRINLGELRIALNQTADAERLLAASEACDIPALRDRITLLRARIARSSGVRDGDLQSAAELQQAAVRAQPVGRGTAGTAPRDADFLTWFDRRALQVRTSLGEESAKALLGRMRDDFAHSESPLVASRLLVLDAMVVLADARAVREVEPRRDVEDLLVRAVDFLATMCLDYELYEALRLLVVHRRECGAPSETIDPLIDRAQEILERMCEGLSAAERAQFLLNKWSQDEENLALHVNRFLDRQKAQPRSSRWLSGARDIHQLLHLAFHIRMAIGRRVDPMPRPSPLRRLFFASRHRASILFIVLPENVVTIRLGWLDATLRVARISRVEVRALVRRWHEAITGISDENPAVIASTLAERLGLAELLDLPRRVRSLTILPDDALHGFPFAALRLNDRYLVERFAISITHEPFRQPRPRTSRGTACVVAVDRELPGWRALPATPAQIDDIAALAARHAIPLDILLNQPIGPEELLPRMERASILHLSCHGTFSASQPDETGLVLLGDDGVPRLLALKGIGDADLKRIEHANVVACWGADNYVVPGRWVVSFPEVLRRAGVRSVLASLWEIDDVRVTSMLQRFHRNLDTMPRDQALRHVQIEEISSDTNQDPAWWAGLQLYGETGRIAW
jgi:tetratricopeptide (TPR) repeat protein